MYLHLGQDVVVRNRDIVGIFDIDNTTVSRQTRDFLAAAEKGGAVITVSPELPKSFVVCSPPGKKRKKTTVYVAQMAPRTLYARAELTERHNSKEDFEL